MANVKQPCRVHDQILGIVNLDSWPSLELRVALMWNTLESKVERIQRNKEQNNNDSSVKTK